MGFRTIVISRPCKLSYKNESLVIRGEDSLIVHLNEIATLIIDSSMVTLTAYLLCALLQHKIKVVLCDEARNPLGEMVSYYGSHDTSGQLRDQLRWADERKGMVWQLIIRQKILNQSALLQTEHPEESRMLRYYALEVMPHDETNREGHAAKVYFNRVFGPDFSRSLASDINSALNYGYALLLSTMNKEIVARGYITQLGIHHCNTFNHFNLSSDFMEPLRHLIDRRVLSLGEKPFDKECKRALLNVFSDPLRYRGRLLYLNETVAQYVGVLTDALESDNALMEEMVIIGEDTSNACYCTV